MHTIYSIHDVVLLALLIAKCQAKVKSREVRYMSLPAYNHQYTSACRLVNFVCIPLATCIAIAC